jgi:hypothetical protein
MLKVALLALTLGLIVPASPWAELRPGMVIDQSTADETKDLLPPEIYEHYKKGEYTNGVVDFPDSKFQWDDGYAEATEHNRQNLVLSPEKQPVDKASGKRPDYISGQPFPDIRQEDPDAGYKVLWNTIFTVYNGGNSRNVTDIKWMSPGGVERAAGQDVVFLYYDGQPKEYIPKSNPDNLIFQFIALTLNPADLQGTAALSWRYKDPGKRDASWAYVPALRRVRSVSPTNRSDGFLGSDLSQDDGNFFDGKPEDFVWKLIGKREALRFTDPDSLAGKVQRNALPGGGWRTTFINNDRTAGFQVKGWKGVSWAPVTSALTKRNVWVIEGTPKDQYYLYGRIELWIDSYTYEGAWNRRFSWKNELMNTYQITGPATAPYNATQRWWGSTFGWQCAENIKQRRATLAGLQPTPDSPNDRRLPLAPSQFDYQALASAGK